jgi:hypothetical protein
MSLGQAPVEIGWLPIIRAVRAWYVNPWMHAITHRYTVNPIKVKEMLNLPKIKGKNYYRV